MLNHSCISMNELLKSLSAKKFQSYVLHITFVVIYSVIEEDLYSRFFFNTAKTLVLNI